MEMKIENIEKKDYKSPALQRLKSIIKEWKKMPNSWIDDEDYKSLDEEALEQKRKNKFRANYFNAISGNFEILLPYLNIEDRKKFQEDFNIISDKVHQRMSNKLSIEESSVDEVDKFAEDLIKKLEA